MTVDTKHREEALEVLAGTGAEYKGGLANHGPMAVDALLAMGQAESAARWAHSYRKVLYDAAPWKRSAISEQNWHKYLGDYGALSEWEGFFRSEMEERPWRDVLEAWVWRLAPGFLAAATHGLLRTAHATRGLLDGESELRRDELARGLGYWAARYTELKATDAATPSWPFSEALRRVPVVPVEERRQGFLITEGIAGLAERDDFAPVAGLLYVPDEPLSVLPELTRTFARIYLAHAEAAPIVFVHSVTAPSAIRLLAPALPVGHVQRLVRYAWQADAAFLAAFSLPGAEPALPEAVPSKEDVVEMALDSGDEHAIKFAEACLREHALNPNPVYLAAAADFSRRFGREW